MRRAAKTLRHPNLDPIMIIRKLKYLFAVFLLSKGVVTAQIPKPSLLEPITIDDGLSQGYISCIIQDSKGFMWFGTLGGLNRYDGYDFQVYQFKPDQPNSLSGNNISALYEDRDGFIWVGTWGQGINVLDPKTEKIYRITGKDSIYKHLEELDVWTFLHDTNGDIWIGGQTPTLPYGLFRLSWDPQKLNESSGDYHQFELTTYQLDPDSLPQSNDIFAIHLTDDDRLWIGTGMGLYSSNISTENPEFKIHNNILINENMPYSGVFSIFEEDELLWLGRSGSIQSYNTVTGEWSGGPIPHPALKQVWVEQLNLDQQGRFWFVDRWGRGLFMVKKESISPDMILPESSMEAINSLHVDRSNVIWMGRTARGIYKFSPSVNQFNPMVGLFNEQREAYINHIHEDKQGRLWANNYVVDRKSGEWKKPDFIRQRLDGFRYVTVDSQGVFWAMSAPGQLWAYNPDNKQERLFNFNKDATPDGPIYADHKAILWWGSQGTLHRFDPETSGLRGFVYDPTATPNPVGTFNFILSHGSKGYLWIGTQQGLVRFDESDESLKVFGNQVGDVKSLSGDRVLSILDDPENPDEYLWVGTEGGGLNRMHKTTGAAEHYTTKDGLPDNTIYGILDDEIGQLWLSTNRGLSRFNTQTNVFRNFDKADGLQNTEFNRMAYFKSSSGELFFGGVNGINAFYPDKINDNQHIPTIAITEFRIGNQRISHLDSVSPLEMSISSTDEINLSYEQNMISFVYAALDYVNPGKNQYAYRMKGLSDQWIQAGNSRVANFTNLDPGTYTFSVKGSNNDGVWNEEGTSIRIVINPPWWQTWWAYTIYTLLFLSIGVTITLIQMRRIRLRNQLRLEQQNAESIRELEQAKSRFFSNVTHEFRTPLTLILGPVEELLKQNGEAKSQGSLRSIQRQARHLLRLINQLLDISKLENQGMSVELSRGNLEVFVGDITNSFREMAHRCGIELSFQALHQIPIFDFDPEKLKKIIHNLLSNALKFTPKGGLVTVQLSQVIRDPEPHIKLLIADTGLGIPKKELEHIFDRFYQAESTQEHHTEGTGIGLALSKELAELMGGDILVSSEKSKGSEFTLIIPFILEESTPPTTIPKPLVQSPPIEESYKPEQENIEGIEIEEGLDMVLLVEDHQELRDFIKNQLHQQYTIIEAENGKKGLENAQRYVPDMIITDVMMPEMDGYEFCKKIKQDERTSHIPVIMLTAKSTLESRLQGLEEGADAYLAKPFNKEELLLRIRKLLEVRRLLQEKYQRSGAIGDRYDDSLTVSREQTYLTRAEGVVEKFLDDPNFDVEAFCSEMGMSRTQLHRKLKALTNQSTTGFVRDIRLKTAKQLLENGAGNVTEVAYTVGFNSQTYFSRCFQEKFGFPPKDAMTSYQINS